jgi:hypothetical protein
METASTAKNHLNALIDIKPRNILQYLRDVEPSTRIAMFDKLTGYKVSDLYNTFSEDMLLEIGRKLEAEAREYERLYSPNKGNPIPDNEPPYSRILQPIASRFVLGRKDTEVCMELYSWNSDIQSEYLENIDGAAIPVDRKLLACYKNQCSPLDINSYMLPSRLPGKVHVLKKIDFQLKPTQKIEGYLASQAIIVDSYSNDLPLYTIDAAIDDMLKRIKIYTRTNIFPDFCSRYIYSYELEAPRASKFFAESLCNFIAYEIKKINIECVAKAEESYKKSNVPPSIITTLYVFASNDLSYTQNKELHSLLALSGKFGSVQVMPEKYMMKTRSWLPDVQELVYTWGFRVPEKI